MKKKDVFEIITILAKAVIFTMLFVLFALSVFYNAHDNAKMHEKSTVEYIENWTLVKADGTSFDAGRQMIAEESIDEPYELHAKLPDDLKDNTFLCFQTGKDIKVYVDGAFRSDFDEQRDGVFTDSCVKRFFMLIPMYGADSGCDITIKRVPSRRGGLVVPESFIGTEAGILMVLMENYGTAFLISSIIMIFSLVVAVISLIMKARYKMNIPMLYGAFSIFVVAAWIMTNSMLFPFIFGHYHIDGLLNYILCLMIPIAPLIYLNAVMNGRYKKIMSVMMIVSTVSCVLWPILHFAGIVRFSDALITIDVILGIDALTAGVILVIDNIKGYAKNYRYTSIGFTAFIACGLLEIVFITFLNPKQQELPMFFGLSIFLIFVVAQQIEDLKKVMEEKQEAIDLSEAKTRFLASMSHEIRTPINSILGMNEMILRENNDTTIAEYSRNIKSSGKMLLMLVNDVLDFSKIEAGKLEITEADYRLSSVLCDIYSLIKERADEKKLDFSIVLVSDVPDGLYSDEFRLRQVLINLLSNAVKYTDKGSVSLNVGGCFDEDDRYILKFSVIDTGRGIKEEDRVHLFEAFSRADIRKNINIEGTGLGLAIVKNILDSMNGSVEVESEYGRGSSFNVTLPVICKDKTPVGDDFLNKGAAEEQTEDVCDFTAADAKVLAVDDNLPNLTILSLFLQRSLIEPELCSDGKEAIQKCKEEKYDLILLDHMMPGLSGLETLKEIRTGEASLNKDTTAIVLTANAVAGSRKMYLDAGFADYLTKPLDHRVLEKTVRQYLPPEKVKSV